MFSKDLSCLPGTAVAATATASVPGTDPVVQLGSQLLRVPDTAVAATAEASVPGTEPAIQLFTCLPGTAVAATAAASVPGTEQAIQLFTCLPGTAVAATAAASVPGTDPAVQQGSQLLTWYNCCRYSCGFCSGQRPSCSARISAAYPVQLLLLQLRLLFRALTQLFSKDLSCLPGTAVAATAAASVPGTDPAVQQGFHLLTWYSCCCYSCGFCSGH
jgi:hypothetical protein